MDLSGVAGLVPEQGRCHLGRGVIALTDEQHRGPMIVDDPRVPGEGSHAVAGEAFHERGKVVQDPGPGRQLVVGVLHVVIERGASEQVTELALQTVRDPPQQQLVLSLQRLPVLEPVGHGVDRHWPPRVQVVRAVTR